MTITGKDQEQFQSRVTDFHAQPEPDDCLPTAVKNILDDLANRENEPQLRHSLSDINGQLDYTKGAAARSDRIASRLDPLLENAGYETATMTGMNLEQLATIIESDNRSLPVCELDSEYFDSVDSGYNPEPGIDGYGRFNHVVIPFTTNDESVLCYDPYIHFFNDFEAEGEADGMELPFTDFYEWWSRPEKRWTLWVEPMKQQTLSAAAQG